MTFAHLDLDFMPARIRRADAHIQALTSEVARLAARLRWDGPSARAAYDARRAELRAAVAQRVALAAFLAEVPEPCNLDCRSVPGDRAVVTVRPVPPVPPVVEPLPFDVTLEWMPPVGRDIAATEVALVLWSVLAPFLFLLPLV